MTPELSVLIPARKEQWLGRTITDVLEHAKADTEIIVVLDGAWPEEPIPQHPRVTMVYQPVPIGQRAATNLAAQLSTARYVMKLDAHCSVAEGFDVELIRAAEMLGPDVTQIPAQRNLHVYDRVCPCGRREYQGSPSHPCVSCGRTDWTLDVVWKPRSGTKTEFWRFDNEPRFQYWGDYKQRPEAQGEICDVMSSLGACFFMARERFQAIGGLDEAAGSWGSYGIEIACKSWLSGGRHVVNRRTWFAHFFRVGGIGFPYEIHGSDQERAREHARRTWFANAWPGQTRPLSWLLEKFAPIPGWHDDAGRERLDQVTAAGRRFGRVRPPAPTKGLVYYTDGRGDPRILDGVRRQLLRAELPIASATLQPLDFGRNVVVAGERGYLTMFRQILAGLEVLDTDIAFLVEHDVLYAADYFAFTPPRDDCYFYNLNTWKVNAETGHAVTYETKQTSQLCAHRQLLIEHYRTRIARVERDGFTRRMGFEPGSHRRPERVDDVPSDIWRAPIPSIDIRHGHNLTASRWHPSQFRDPRNCRGWQDADQIPGWGVTGGRFWDFLEEHTRETQQAVA